MTHLINKSALVAEIKRRINYWHYKPGLIKSGYAEEEDRDIIAFINSLEVKEVDLEKEIDTYLSIWYQQVINSNPQLITIHDCKRIAKHFFELGLKTKVE